MRNKLTMKGERIMFKRENNKYKIIEVRDDATITHYLNTKKSI